MRIRIKELVYFAEFIFILSIENEMKDWIKV